MKALALLAAVALGGSADEGELHAFVDAYCTTCHGGAEPEGDFTFDGLALALDARAERRAWDQVLEYVADAEMPPAEADVFPSSAEREAFLAALRAAMDAADRAAPVVPPPVRRLTRGELLHVVRDAFGVRGLELPSSLPEDASEHAFDTMVEGLHVSPAFLDGVLELATDVADRMVPDLSRQTRFASAAREWDFGKLGWPKGDFAWKLTGVNVAAWSGAVFDHRFTAPTSGTYHVVLRVRATEEGARGVDGEPLRLVAHALVPSQYDFPERQPRSELPRVGQVEVVDAKPHAVTLEVALEKGEAFQVFLENRLPGLDLTGGRNRIQLGALVDTARSRDEPTVQVFGMRVVGPVAPLERQREFWGADAPPSDRAGLDAVLVPLAERLWGRPPTVAEAEALVTRALEAGADDPRLALHDGVRRVLMAADTLMRGVQAESLGRASDFELADQLAAFLWSSRADDALRARAADGTLREPEVLRAEVARLLADPRSERFVEAFAGQWLGTRRLAALNVCNNRYPWSELLRDGYVRGAHAFFGAVLHENLPIATFVDADFTYANELMREVWGLPGEYPGLDFREAHQIQSQVWPPVERLDLTDLPAGTPAIVVERGGVLGLPSVLAATGDGTESNPILRGVWVLENLLGDPPPPPPSNVPALVADTTGARTIREQLERHQAVESCAKCHASIDPLGFALENFDAIGGWRESYPPIFPELTSEVSVVEASARTTPEPAPPLTLPIDPTGTLPDGTPLAGLADIKAYLEARPEVFATCLIEKLLEYALGRELLPADRRLARELAAAAPPEGWRFADLIQAICASEAFVPE